jgi:hypothetical protein
MSGPAPEGLPHDGPPDGLPDALEQAARWLDSFDRFYRALLAEHGVDPDSSPVAGDEVQRHLRALGAWFAERPALAWLAWRQVQEAARGR